MLEEFLTAHPQSPLLPEALYRLGQALQSLGRYEQAVARYTQNQDRFPRTPAAMRSMVPMARCYIAMGPPSYPDAEKVLLSVLEQPSEMGRYAPEALEYREALFLLGDLYDRWDKPSRAIGRLEEFLERYPKDPRLPTVQFALANAYRKRALFGAASQPATSGATRPQGFAQSAVASWRRAEELFAEVIQTLEGRPRSGLSPLEQLCLRYSYLYRADCAFDVEQYERAIALYEEVGRRFRADPIALQAGVQILNAYQRLGRHEQARVALQRMRMLLKSIPVERFNESPGGEDLAYWQGLLDWIEKSDLF